MNSKDYWAKRSALDMVEYMRTADETALLMRQNAMQAFAAIEEEIKGIFSAFAGFGISETEAKQIISGDGTVLQRLRRAAEKLTDPQQKQALLSAINSAGAYRYRIQRLEEVGRQITEQCNSLYKAQLEATEAAMRDVAQNAYYHTIFNIQQQTGLAFSFAQFPKNQVNRILAFNWSGAHFSQRIWRDTEVLAQSIKDELLVSLLSGRSEAKTARVIQEQFNVNSYCARRLVRTESSYAANAAVFEGYQEAGIDSYRFIATLDFKTSEKCAELDSRVFKTSDKKVGINAPPMHPFCRSTTIADFGADTLAGLERRVRGKDGKNVVLPADMSYADWRKQFVEEKALDKSAGSGIIGVDERKTQFLNDLRSGKVNTSLDVKNQNKHIASTEWKNNVKQQLKKIRDGDVKASTPKSRLYTNVDPVALFEKYAGTGNIKFQRKSSTIDEFVTADSFVGITFDRKQRKYVKTRRFQIRYQDNGYHLFPVLEIGDDKL